MFIPPRTHKKWLWPSGCLCSLIQMWSTADAQNFTMQVANPDPLGLGQMIPGGDKLELGLSEGIKGVFAYGIRVHSVYDSNFFLDEGNAQSEITTNFSPWLSYWSDPEGGAKFSFGVNYQPTCRIYQDNSNLNGIDQTGDISFRAEGAKTLITAYGKYSEVSGTDRLTGTFVTGTVVNTGVQGSYKIAPRTTLGGMWSVAMSDYGSSASVGSDIYNTQLGAYWAATERFSFGPSLRYSVAESDNIGSRDAWSLSVQAQYLVGEKTHIQGSIGVEYAQSSEDGEKSTVGLTGSLTASHEINAHWTVASSVLYATVPSPTETGYVINNLEISAGLNRNLLRATLGFGIDYNFSNYESVGAATADLDDENNLALFISYRRNLFSERVGFDSQIRYTVNDGKTNWSQIQLTAGLSVTF